MPLYETTLITRQEMSPADVTKLVDDYAAVITDLNGKVVLSESWGLRTLAYKIQKNRKGYYHHFRLDAPFAALQEMERQARLNEDVIRLMTVKVEALSEEPSAILSQNNAPSTGPSGRPMRSGPGGPRRPRPAPSNDE